MLADPQNMLSFSIFLFFENIYDSFAKISVRHFRSVFDSIIFENITEKTFSRQILEGMRSCWVGGGEHHLRPAWLGHLPAQPRPLNHTKPKNLSQPSLHDQTKGRTSPSIFFRCSFMVYLFKVWYMCTYL